MAKKETPPFQIVPRSEIEGELSHGAFRLLQVIRQHCISCKYCWLSIRRLADTMRTSPRTTTRYIKELIDGKLITRQHMDGTISIYTPKDLYRTRATDGVGFKQNPEFGQTRAKNDIEPEPKTTCYNRRRNKKEEERESPALGKQSIPEEYEPSDAEIERTRILKAEFVERNRNGNRKHTTRAGKRKHPNRNAVK